MLDALERLAQVRMGTRVLIPYLYFDRLVQVTPLKASWPY